MMPSMHARKGTSGGLMRNVSSSHEEKYQTWDGNVTVTNFKRGLWSVHPRGYQPFMVGSKKEALDQALGLSAKRSALRAPSGHATRVTRATKAKAGTRRVHATKTKVAKAKAGARDKINIDQLAKLFDLPDWDRIDEMNQQHYWEMSRGAGDDEEAQLEAEREAQDEVYGQWYDAVESTASKLFEEHGLELKPTGKQGTKERRYDFKIVPSTSWDAAANKIHTTINGVGDFHFNNLKEFLDSGPYTARQAVLSHLGYVKRYPAVYGGQGARQLYDQAWR